MVTGTSILGLVGCIIGATAKNIDTLIGASLCNGLAAAGQLSFGIILGELVPNKQRGPIVTLVFLSSLPFAGEPSLEITAEKSSNNVTVFGPIIARSFILHTAAGWRWSYYLGIIMSGLAIILYQFMYHPPTYDQLHVHGKTKFQMFKELDFVGIFLYVAGLVLFLIGLSWGGRIYPWKSAAVICTIVIGFLTLVAFGLYGKLKGYMLWSSSLTENRGVCLQRTSPYAAAPFQERWLCCNCHGSHHRGYGLL